VTAASTPDVTESQPPLPEELVGRWVSTGSGGAEIIYEFAADGAYKYAGVLLQQRDTGMFSFIRSAVGTVSVDGDVLTLRPDHGTEKLQDPDVPSASTEHPIETTEETLAWRIDGGGRLSLTDASGNTIVYARQ
jgi:hypothetical protein